MCSFLRTKRGLREDDTHLENVGSGEVAPRRESGGVVCLHSLFPQTAPGARTRRCHGVERGLLGLAAGPTGRIKLWLCRAHGSGELLHGHVSDTPWLRRAQ